MNPGQHSGNDPITPWRHQAFEHLLAGFAASTTQSPAERWRWLEAAHVLGQPVLNLHWRSHVAMLQMARQQGDAREALGQALRLALVPLGHALQRLPAGNTGRARINPWRPMPPAAPLAALIDAALAATQPPPVSAAETVYPGL